MAHLLAVQGQLSKEKYLQVMIDSVITLETGQKAESVENTRTYQMRVKVFNSYKNNPNDSNNYDDKWWYYDISIRIIPKTSGLQLYTGANFQTTASRRDIEIHRLREQEPYWIPIYFKWNKPQPKDVNELEFNFGLYAQEVQRVKNWTTLTP
jgi:hypothetical protein